MKKFPPIEKILEAYTAIADGHVKLENDQALVTSSNEAKTYTVTFHDILILQMTMPHTGKAILAIPELLY
ncbi:hypothetical protein LMB56_09630 [Limosilactobacillus reuteri]|nr:hypothetical protein [Limosilactobacillus reuteri]MCC4438839.1 hypothetical protein [Limosilactobacillus reuteri]MCC4442846.1 hypothetical protein [Limosilactobacillus reuteri]MCC4444823.1 hypothetical protein [Limosilactobacillus reuteri]MCC4446799.1 hypothetical protein [Limosilactobacillus reuteri]